jgi:hypothetical protein
MYKMTENLSFCENKKHLQDLHFITDVLNQQMRIYMLPKIQILVGFKRTFLYRAAAVSHPM